MITYVVVAIAVAIIASLGFYAGKLLSQLKQQQQKQKHARDARIARIMESVYTIALAVEQQQCNLSEGAIRLVNLLDSVPIESPPNCERDYPALFELFSHVRRLPTHQARKEMDKTLRAKQDHIREELETQLESRILKEVADIRHLNFG